MGFLVSLKSMQVLGEKQKHFSLTIWSVVNETMLSKRMLSETRYMGKTLTLMKWRNDASCLTFLNTSHIE